MNERNSRLSGHLAGLDSLFAFAMVLIAAIWGNSSRIPAGQIHEFLQMRITLVNALFAGFFMVAWAFCFRLLRGRNRAACSRKLWELFRAAQ